MWAGGGFQQQGFGQQAFPQQGYPQQGFNQGFGQAIHPQPPAFQQQQHGFQQQGIAGMGYGMAQVVVPVQKPHLKQAQQQQRQQWNNPLQVRPPAQQKPPAPAAPKPMKVGAQKAVNPLPPKPAAEPQEPKQKKKAAKAGQEDDFDGALWAMGWGMGGGGGSGSEKPLPDGVQVDKEARYTGKVQKYSKWSGFGWVELDKKDVVPDDKIFVFHKNLNSEDRFPFLVDGMEVELSLHPHSKRWAPGKIFVRAKNVTQPGGKPIAIQDKVDAEKKIFVGGQNLRYTGKLQWYCPFRTFGYVDMDEGFDMGEEKVPKNLKVEKAEVNSGGKELPSKIKDIKVEFGIWKTKKGEFRVYNMTLPGLEPITVPALEHRSLVGSDEFKGTINVNWWQHGYGMVELASGTELPEDVKAKMKKDKEGKPGNLVYYRTVDVRDNQWLKKGQAVRFQLYTDDKGIGACDVHAEADEKMADADKK